MLEAADQHLPGNVLLARFFRQPALQGRDHLGLAGTGRADDDRQFRRIECLVQRIDLFVGGLATFERLLGVGCQALERAAPLRRYGQTFEQPPE